MRRKWEERGCIHADNAEGVGSLADVGDLDGFDESGKGLLHDVFDHIHNRREHIRVLEHATATGVIHLRY